MCGSAIRIRFTWRLRCDLANDIPKDRKIDLYCQLLQVLYSSVTLGGTGKLVSIARYYEIYIPVALGVTGKLTPIARYYEIYIPLSLGGRGKLTSIASYCKVYIPLSHWEGQVN